MARWKHTLDLSDVFHDGSRTFEERRTLIVARIRNASFYDIDGDCADIIDDLSNSPNHHNFDYFWNQFYDWADDNRVWVKTR